MTMPQPQFDRPGSIRPDDGSRTPVRLLVASLLVVFVGGYGVAVFLSRDIWHNSREATRLTFTAQTSDGSTRPNELMTETADVVRQRLKRRGAAVAVDGMNVTVTVPGRNVKPDVLRDLIKTGRLDIRPVVQAVPAQPQDPTTSPAKPAAPDVVDFEKQIRQSADPRIQMLAIQVQASRCHDADPLAGKDDPSLPLVTCGSDNAGGEAAYLLDKSILNGADIARASSGFDEQRGIYVVSMEFTPKAAKVWAAFTTSHWQQGTQTAFVVDTHVVSAPAIREPIVAGKVEISGQFTQKSARELADVLGSGALPVPLAFTSSSEGTLRATTLSKILRVAIVGLGIGIAAIAIVVIIYLARRPPKFVAGASTGTDGGLTHSRAK